MVDLTEGVMGLEGICFYLYMKYKVADLEEHSGSKTCELLTNWNLSRGLAEWQVFLWDACYDRTASSIPSSKMIGHTIAQLLNVVPLCQLLLRLQQYHFKEVLIQGLQTRRTGVSQPPCLHTLILHSKINNLSHILTQFLGKNWTMRHTTL